MDKRDEKISSLKGDLGEYLDFSVSGAYTVENDIYTITDDAFIKTFTPYIDYRVSFDAESETDGILYCGCGFENNNRTLDSKYNYHFAIGNEKKHYSFIFNPSDRNYLQLSLKYGLSDVRISNIRITKHSHSVIDKVDNLYYDNKEDFLILNDDFNDKSFSVSKKNGVIKTSITSTDNLHITKVKMRVTNNDIVGSEISFNGSSEIKEEGLASYIVLQSDIDDRGILTIPISFYLPKGYTLYIYSNYTFVASKKYSFGEDRYPSLCIYSDTQCILDNRVNAPFGIYPDSQRFILKNIKTTCWQKKHFYNDNFRKSVRFENILNITASGNYVAECNEGLFISNNDDFVNDIKIKLPVVNKLTQFIDSSFNDISKIEEIYFGGYYDQSNFVKLSFDLSNKWAKVYLNDVEKQSWPFENFNISNDITLSMSYNGMAIYNMSDGLPVFNDRVNMGLNAEIQGLLNTIYMTNNSGKLFIGFKLKPNETICINNIDVYESPCETYGADCHVPHDLFGKPIQDNDGNIYLILTSHTPAYRMGSICFVYKVNLNNYSVNLIGSIRGKAIGSTQIVYDNIKNVWYILYSTFIDEYKAKIQEVKFNPLENLDDINFSESVFINVDDIQSHYWDVDLIYYNNKYFATMLGGHIYTMNDPLGEWEHFGNTSADGEGSSFLVSKMELYVLNSPWYNNNDGTINMYNINKLSSPRKMSFDVSVNVDNPQRTTPSWGAVFGVYNGYKTIRYAIIHSMRTKTDSADDYTYGDIMIYKALDNNIGLDYLDS